MNVDVIKVTVIIDISSKVISIPISNDPRIWILGDTDLLGSSHHKKYFALLAGTAGKNVY